MKKKTFDLKVKKRPKQGRAKVMVEALLDSAARILEGGGYAALTTNRIAEVAGVSIGSVYEYFPNKQALVAALAARELNGILNEVARGMDVQFQNPDLYQAYHDWFMVMLESLEKRRAVLRALRREAPFVAEIPEAKHVGDALLTVAALGRRQAEQAGRVPTRFRSRETSLFLLTTMVGAVIERTAFDRPPQVTREQIIDTLTEMVLKLL